MGTESDFNSDLAFFENLRVAREKEAKAAQKLNTARDTYLNDTEKMSRDIAVRTKDLLPEKVKVAKAPIGGSIGHREVDASFSEENPLAGIGSQVSDVLSKLKGKKLKGDIKGEGLTDLVYQKVLQKRLPAAYQYKLKQDTSILGDETGNLPGYDKFREKFDAENQPDVSRYYKGLTPKGIATNLGIAAAGNLAIEGVGRAGAGLGMKGLAKLAGRGLFGLPTPGAGKFVTKAAGLALMTAADFAVFDAASEVVGQSKWAKAREDEPLKVLGAEMVAGLGAGVVASKVVKGGSKAMMSAVKTYGLEKARNEAAAEVLGKTGTVSSLMEWNKSLKRLERSKAVSVGEVDNFIQLNKKEVGRLTLEDAVSKYNPDIPGGHSVFSKEGISRMAETERSRKAAEAISSFEKEAGYSPEVPGSAFIPKQLPAPGTQRVAVEVVEGLPTKEPLLITDVQERALTIRKSAGTPQEVAENSWMGEYSVTIHDPKFHAHTPMLEGTGARLALPAPVENIVADQLPLRARVAIRTAYEQNRNLRKATIILGEKGPPDLSPDSLTKITEFFTHHINATKVPETLLGPDPVLVNVLKEINLGLAKSGNKAPATLTDNVWGYGLDKVPFTQKLRMLDNAAVEEVKAAAESGIPSSLAVPEAAKKSAARKVRKNAAAEVKRDAEVVAATKKGVVTRKKTTEVITLKAAETPVSEGIAATDVSNLMKKGAEKSTITNLEVGAVTGRTLTPEQIAKFKAAKEKQKRGALSRVLASKEEKMAADAALMDASAADPEIGSYIKKALVTVPLSAVALVGMDASDADASVLGSVSALGVDLAKKAVGDSASKLISVLKNSSLVGEKGRILGRVEKWMDGISVKPTMDVLEKTTSKIPAFFRNTVMTPAAVAGRFYKAEANPLVELATRMTAMHNNIKMHSQAVKEILAMVPEYKNSTEKVRQAMKPLVEKYEVPLAEAGYHEGMIARLGDDLKKTNKAKDPEVYAELSKSLKEHHAKLNGLKADTAGYEAEWTKLAQGTAKEHSSARIALALEDTAEFIHYPWLKGMMTPNELSAVSMLKDLNKVTETRIIEAGGKVIKDRPYAHHALHPDSNTVKLREAFAGLTPNVENAVNLARLNSRNVGSKMLMPDVEYMYAKYVPDVERRIQGMEFWKKGQEGGWHAHVKELRKNGVMTKELDELWTGINKSLEPVAHSGMAQWANRYYSMEVLWRLFASPSVGFKHLMKQTGNLAIFPPDVWAKAVVKTPGVMARAKVMELQERWPKVFGGIKLKQNDAVDLVRAMTNQGKYNSSIAELDMFDTPLNRFDKILGKVNETGSFIVGAVESFDRTATVLMGMEMAAKKGMTPSQAAFAVYDSILKANFLSGVHNPSWVRDPYARAFFMFQGTPFKLMEQRLLLAAKGGKAIVKAGGVTLEQLKELKHFIKEGEYRVKHGMILDALNSEKDIFGQSSAKQFAVSTLMIGGLIGIGDKMFDSNIQDQVFHPPFIKMEGESPGVYLNPVTSAAYKTWTKRHEEDRGLLFTEFVNNWLGHSGAVPSTFRKAMRLTENDIPEIYRNSKLRYFFGVPAAKGE